MQIKTNKKSDLLVQTISCAASASQAHAEFKILV